MLQLSLLRFKPLHRQAEELPRTLSVVSNHFLADMPLQARSSLLQTLLALLHPLKGVLVCCYLFAESADLRRSLLSTRLVSLAQCALERRHAFAFFEQLGFEPPLVAGDALVFSEHAPASVAAFRRVLTLSCHLCRLTGLDDDAVDALQRLLDFAHEFGPLTTLPWAGPRCGAASTSSVQRCHV